LLQATSTGRLYSQYQCIQLTAGSGVRRKFSWGGLVEGHMVVICIWYALFVTSQYDVISMFPNHRFGEVCWHNMHVFLHPFPLFYVSLQWI